MLALKVASSVTIPSGHSCDFFLYLVVTLQDLFPTPITLLLLKTDFDESKLRLRPDTFAVSSLMYFCFQLLKVAAEKIKVLLPEKRESALCM